MADAVEPGQPNRGLGEAFEASKEEARKKAASEPQLFAVVAEKEGYSGRMLQLHLTLDELLGQIVHPYREERRFFIDGVPCDAKSLNRIKILREHETLFRFVMDNHCNLFAPSGVNPPAKPSVPFNDGVDAICRVHAEDVTAQIISAYEVAKPTLVDEIGEHLIPTRVEFFQSAKAYLIKTFPGWAAWLASTSTGP